jgi:myosin-light-chain kinase
LSQTISIFRQLCCGLNHIHEQNMIFRDVHPTRIHLKNGEIKLNLVGMPYNFKKLLKNESFSGHLNYSAPEILESGFDNHLSSKVDIWSLGCCLYYLATKKDPFDGGNPGEIKQNIRKGKIDRDEEESQRHFIVNQLLQKSLTVDINLRPSCLELIDIIDHLVLTNIGIFNEEQKLQLASTMGVNPADPTYQNKVVNKNIPEFFKKKNLFEPINIKSLPFQ